MTRKQIERERDLNRRLVGLDREEASLEVDPVKEVADALHTSFCNLTHDKNCSYYYEQWDHANTIRQHYVKKAIGLLKIADKDKILAIIDIIKHE
jgi:hypothetical protein